MNSELVTVDQQEQEMLPVQQAAQQTEQLSVPMQLMQTAVQNGGAVEQLEKLMDLYERDEARKAKNAYFKALTQFQANMPVIEKKKQVNFPGKNGGQATNYKYAPLDDIMIQIRDTLRDAGLTVRWEQEQGDGGVITVTCIVTHELGHSEKVQLSGLPDTSGSKSGAKSIGSTVTYLKRYTVTGSLGIATADEDYLDRIPPSEEKVANEVGDFNFYPDASFVKSFPDWKKYIQAGKTTPQGIINKVQTKYTLTDEQINQIKGLA